MGIKLRDLDEHCAITVTVPQPVLPLTHHLRQAPVTITP